MKVLVLGFIILSCLSFLLVHIIAVRYYWRHQKIRTSPQGLVVKLALWSNLIVFTVFILLFCQEIGTFTDKLISAVYCFLVYNCFCFSYFVVFQLSETGRRIRMLRNLYENPAADLGKTLKDYSIENMVLARVDRLEKMGQIESDPTGSYRIKGRFLLLGAKALRFVSLVIVGSKNRIDPNWKKT